MPIDIQIVEVGPRDGLQNAKAIMSTALKKRWIKEAVGAGLTEIEVCSFVPAKVVPGMQDAAEITRYAAAIKGLTTAVLIPNAKGGAAAIAAGAHKLSMPISVSKSHNQANLRKTHEQAIEEFRAVVAMTREMPADKRPRLEIGLATSFGCSIEGVVPLGDVVRLAERVIEAGADAVTASDTIGIANPLQVRNLYKTLFAAVGRERANAAHFHNTRGQGLANVLAALDSGVTSFDACLAGLGGCPFAPGASGNVCTEDVVWMLEEMGLKTGIDLGRLLEARAILVEGLPGEKLSGHVAEAGLDRTRPIDRVASAR